MFLYEDCVIIVIVLETMFMKILYKQTQNHGNAMGKYGIQNCYFKEISLERDCERITKKVHHHTEFELHLITEGAQEYDIAGEKYRLENGSFLLIYPNIPHKITAIAPHTKKYSITFNKQIKQYGTCLFGNLSERISSNFCFIKEEFTLKKEISSTLIENSILEILVWVFRLSGIKEKADVQQQNENLVISLAKKYIEDNIELNISVANVSQYCHLSTKQLTRIFKKYEDISLGEYIAKKRTKRIEELLTEGTLSLKEISEAMNFNNEYYFNMFFKKHTGMPPGAYKKMFGK